MSRLLLFSALNYLFSAPCYLKTAFLLANHNREIFSCILLGYDTVQALFLLVDISEETICLVVGIFLLFLKTLNSITIN